MKIQTIGHDKLNQLRHARYFKNIHGMVEHMKKHAASMRPKFDTVLASLEKELGGLEIGSWLAPRGGYFISFDAMEGCAKAIVAKAKEAGGQCPGNTASAMREPDIWKIHGRGYDRAVSGDQVRL